MQQQTHKKQIKTARISPDRLWVGVTAIVLVLITMVTAHVLSFTMIADAARWAGVPESADWVRFLAPLYIDGAIITYTLAYSIHNWRGDTASARHALRNLRLATGLSMLINGLHTLAHWGWGFEKYELWVGLVISIAAPFFALVSAEQVVKLTFQREPEPESEEDQAFADQSPLLATDTAPVAETPTPLKEEHPQAPEQALPPPPTWVEQEAEPVPVEHHEPQPVVGTQPRVDVHEQAVKLPQSWPVPPITAPQQPYLGEPNGYQHPPQQ